MKMNETRIKTPKRPVAVWFLAALAVLGTARASDPAAKPNVLFLISDDLNCRIGC